LAVHVNSRAAMMAALLSVLPRQRGLAGILLA